MTLFNHAAFGSSEPFGEDAFWGAAEQGAEFRLACDDVSSDSFAQAALSGEAYLSMGDRHYQNYLTRAAKQDLESAIQHYQSALAVTPELSQAYVRLATALWDKGSIHVEQALTYCQTALAYDDTNAEAHLYLGYFFKQSGQMKQAVRHFQQAVAYRPFALPKARLALGATLTRQATRPGNSPVNRLALMVKGLAHFGVGMLCLPLDGKAMHCAWQAAKTDLAIQSVLMAARMLGVLQLKQVASGLYHFAAAKLPEEPIFHHLLGDYYRNQGLAKRSIFHYNRALELEPENLSVQKKLGKAYTQCNDTDNATRSFEAVVTAGEADFATLYDLAQLYTEQKCMMKALYYFKEAVLLEPENPYVHSNMAYVLFKLDDYEGATEEYRKAIQHGEDPVWTATVAQTLGTIYYQVFDDLESALTLFHLAAELDPTNLECQTMIAELYFEQGNFEEALEIYTTLRSCDPTNADCHNYIGYLLWQMDRNEEAIASYRESLRLDPENAIACNNLGVIYLDELYNAKEAERLFEQAVYHKPDYTLAVFNLGRSLEMQRRTAEAARHYTRAAELNEVGPELSQDEIVERLEALFAS